MALHPDLVWLTHHETSLGFRSFAYKTLNKDPFSNTELFLQEGSGGRVKKVLCWKRRGSGFSPGFPSICCNYCQVFGP